MKRILALLAFLPMWTFGAAFDVGVDQRAAANNVWEKRLLVSPATTGIMTYNPVTLLPVWVTLGQGLQVSSGVLSATAAAATWDSITGKPTAFAPAAHTQNWSTITSTPTSLGGYGITDAATSAQVAGKFANPTGTTAQYLRGDGSIAPFPALFSGAYADLTGTPSTFAAAAHTHGAADVVSGVFAEARIPAIPISKTTGLQTTLDAKYSTPSGTVSQYLRGDGSVAPFPALFSGAYGELSGVPSTFVPSAHTQAFSTITGTPTTLAGYGITDGATLAALSGKFNTPTGTTAQYLRGDGTSATFPVIPAGQVQTDWNLSSGVASIANKPTSFTPSAHTQAFSTITSTPTTLSGYGITDAAGTPAPAAATRTLNAAYQINATRPVLVSYSVDISVVSLLLAGTQGTVTLQYADTSAMTSPVTVASATNSTGGVLNVSNIGTAALVGFVPAGKFVRIVTANTAGTPTFTFRNGQETIF